LVSSAGMIAEFADESGDGDAVAFDAMWLRLMNDGTSMELADRWDRAGDVDAALARVFGDGVRPLRMEAAVFDAVLVGWRRAQGGRHLTEGTKRSRESLVRRLQASTGRWPWEWQPLDVDEWIEDLGAGPKGRAVSTLRAYQGAIRGFMAYLTDERYPWVAISEREFGVRPVQIVFEENAIVHLTEFEGRPDVRPFTREELVVFFGFCDERVRMLRRLHRKGSLAALRDAALFKVIYAWGLRRREAAKLDVRDFSANREQPGFGRYGMLGVRYGKAVRGGPPRRRAVLTVFDWAVEVVEQYVEEIRPAYGLDDHPALFLTERGGRISTDYVTERFAEYRDASGLAAELTPHSFRRSYVTHLLEDGWDELFVRSQVGHRWASTTAIYTFVSDDYKREAMRRALSSQLGAEIAWREEQR
jgi:integrase/recombinase XerC